MKINSLKFETFSKIDYIIILYTWVNNISQHLGSSLETWVTYHALQLQC